MKRLIKYLWVSAIGFVVYKLVKLAKFWFGPKGGNDGFCAAAEPSYNWYLFSQTVSRWFFRVFNDMEIIGEENIPLGQQFVTVANHASIMDGFIVGGSVRTPLYIMVKKEAFEVPIKGWYLRKVLCFPVDRSIVDMHAIKKAMKVINNGKNLGIFPEGTRNREGYVGEFKPGAIKFALRKKLPILPIYIQNSHKLTPVGKIFPRPVKMKVHIMPPLDTKKLLSEGKNEQDILNLLHEQICLKGTEVMGYDVRLSAKQN